MATQAIAGFEAQVYVDGVRLCELKEVTISLEADSIDASSHCSGGFKSTIVGLKQWTASSEYLYVDGDATQVTVRNAILNGTPLEFQFRTKDLTGSEMLAGTGRILSWELSGPLDDAQAISIEIEGDGVLTFTVVP